MLTDTSSHACLQLCATLLTAKDMAFFDEWISKNCARFYPELDYLRGQDLKEQPGEIESNSAKEIADRVYSIGLIAHLCLVANDAPFR